MPIYNLESVLNCYDEQYLILTYEHLFIASTLREEVLLLQKKEDHRLIENVMTEATGFKLLEVTADRYIDRYSGGQRAILACLLLIALIRTKNIRAIKILLNHVLESISAENRTQLLAKFGEVNITHGTRLFTVDGEQIRELDLN